MSILDFSLNVNRSWGAAHDDDLFTISDVARALGVSRNDVHLIPVEPRPVGQTTCYRKGDIVKWAAADRELPTSMLRTLQAKRKAAALRQAKHADPYTKTGKLKKRFREARKKVREDALRERVGKKEICEECGEYFVRSGNEPKYGRRDRAAVRAGVCWYCGGTLT